MLSVRPILTSQYAHELFVERIRHGHRMSLPGRLLTAQRFAREDESSSSGGIMLVARARKPTPAVEGSA